MITSVFRTNQPDSGIFDLPDLCGENINGFYTDTPKIQARCDFEDGGGWMVILRRKKDVPQPVNISRLWDDYERGFGDLDTEFWYGLRNIHCLTTGGEVELQIKVSGDNKEEQIWTYGHFKVDGPEYNYTLHIGEPRGPSNGYESMTDLDGLQFTTIDRDNDLYFANCASKFYGGGGWWYSACVPLRGSVLTGGHTIGRLLWRNGQGTAVYYSYAEMKVRPKRCTPTNRTESCI